MPSTDDEDAPAPLNDATRKTDPDAIDKANRLLLEHETERLNARLRARKENAP